MWYMWYMWYMCYIWYVWYMWYMECTWYIVIWKKWWIRLKIINFSRPGTKSLQPNFKRKSAKSLPRSWHHGTMAPWHHGTMAPWHHGTMAPWHDHGDFMEKDPEWVTMWQYVTICYHVIFGAQVTNGDDMLLHTGLNDHGLEWSMPVPVRSRIVPDFFHLIMTSKQKAASRLHVFGHVGAQNVGNSHLALAWSKSVIRNLHPYT